MKSFSDACGITDWLRLTIEGPGAKGAELRRFPQPFVVIGRDSRADVLLDDPQVSRRHVYLQVLEGWAFWIDLESRTGTQTEAGPRKSGWLTEGGFLGIGPYVIRRVAGEAGEAPIEDGPARGEPPRDTPLVARAYGRAPWPEVVLEFLNGPSQSMFWPMHRVMSLIGSARGCKFRLSDPSVSAFHASLLRTPAGLWVVDLRGARSITVNAVSVRSSPLVDGDILGIGRYRLRVRCRIRDRGSGEEASDSGRAVRVGRVLRSGRGAPPQLPSPARPAPAPDNPPASPPLPMPIIAAASGVEVVSSGGSAPARPNPLDLTESVLVPLVNQFSLMQQQMFDHFQQAMGLLVQTFGTMHREQMEVIREELDRLHQLTEELQALKSELANPSRGSAQPSGELAGAVAGPARLAAPISNIPAASPVAAVPRAHEPPTGPSLPPQAASPPSPAAVAPGPRPPLGAEPATPPSSSPPVAPRLDQPRGEPGGADAAPPEGDAVLWIHQRIAALQCERETRWQKILKLLPGSS